MSAGRFVYFGFFLCRWCLEGGPDGGHWSGSPTVIKTASSMTTKVAIPFPFFDHIWLSFLQQFLKKLVVVWMVNLNNNIYMIVKNDKLKEIEN